VTGLGHCGPYRLRERVAAGGMGEVFEATRADGGAVAIKRLLPECAKDPVFVGMFLDEARLAQRLRHPNICAVHEHGKEGESYFLAMELIEGPTLKGLLDRRERGLPWPVAVRIVADVAAGLDYAHRMTDEDGTPLGIVHRDVSPANIMVARDGTVKLVDFGLAKAETQLMKTQPGLVKGKFGYLAPEQLGGRIDWRTDLFALGLCLYEAIAHAPLFGRMTVADTVQVISDFTGPPPLAGAVEGVPPALDRVLASALAPRPADRPASASALRAALGKVAQAHASPQAISKAAVAVEVRRTLGD
jgi:serine/threonine protein kinase